MLKKELLKLAGSTLLVISVVSCSGESNDILGSKESYEAQNDVQIVAKRRFETHQKFLEQDGSEPCVDNRGDVNGDGRAFPDQQDLDYLVDYIYNGGPIYSNAEAADVNSDGRVDVLDITFLVDYLYRGGPAPISCLTILL